MAVQTYLYFPGCKINRFLPHYGLSTKTVMAELDIALDETELNCCGYPVRHENFTAAMTAGARNLAIAASKELPLMTPCKCCYGNLKHADHWMRQDPSLRSQVNGILNREGLAWREGIVVKHLLTVLDEVMGNDRLKAHIRRPLRGLPVAAHYGCHALRPGNITQFDNPLSPTIFERLVALTGASAIQWPQRLECCGHPLWQKNNRFSLALMTAKLNDAREAGARLIATACTYCQLQFDQVQHEEITDSVEPLPALLYPQLLGMAMGLQWDRLGLNHNRIKWRLYGD